MKTTKVVRVSTVVEDRTYCNKCGDDLNFGPLINDTLPHIHIEHIWGYGSKYDFEQHSFDICEKCFEKMKKTFKVPVSVKCIVGDL